MKKTLLRIALTTAVMAASAAMMMAQVVVRGQLVDDLGEPLIGANIVEDGTTNGVVTDIDGNFELKVKKNANLTFKFVGFRDYQTKVGNKEGRVNLGRIQMDTDSKTLDDVIVSSTVAVARKTPIAVSTVNSLLIEEKLGTQEFPEILKATPGVHATKQGGGWGDSEIWMRGFDNTNIAVMINGVPMNDMENGNVYWSNWAGLSDVTSNMQTQRGLGASKVSSPSVGGTINIITKGADAKKGGSVMYGMGNDGMNKIVAQVNTGMSKSGWAMTLLGGKTWGNGNFQGGDFEGYNYYLSITKKFNDKHQLMLSAFGAPQTHFQRGSSASTGGALTLAGWEMVEKKYGVTDYRFNGTYGFDANGKRYSNDYNVYHKPQISLNHQWRINEKSNLSTSIYTSIGRGYGNSFQANGLDGGTGSSYSYSDFGGAYYGALNMKFRNADGTFDYQMIKDQNAASNSGSLAVLTKSLNYHNWYGLLSTYSTKFGKYVDFYGGIDFRYYEGLHTNEIVDLMGGDYYLDNYRWNSVSASNNKNVLDDAWKYKKLQVGDAVYRDYTSHVLQGGAFFQAEYSKDQISAFVSGSLSQTNYWRYDRLYYDSEHAESGLASYWGGTAKAGVNWNFTSTQNVFVNVGYISRAPKFSGGAFLSSTVSNGINEDAKNEKIFSVEGGYGFTNEWANIKLNLYYTRWMDKTMTKYTTIQQESAYMNMSGIGAQHMGVELEAKFRPTRWLDVNAMLSLGDWKWKGEATGYFYNENGMPINSKGDIVEAMSADHLQGSIDVEGVRVGGSAQTTANVGFDIKLDKSLKFGAEWTCYGRNYSYYSFTGSAVTPGKTAYVADPWCIPTAHLFDVHASYKFKIGGVNAVLRGNVNNLLNNQYIAKAYNPTGSSGTDKTKITQATADNIYCFINTGRTYSISLKINF